MQKYPVAYKKIKFENGFIALAWIIVTAYQIVIVLLLILPMSQLGKLIMWIVFSLHVAALLSAFLCLRMNVQVPWLP